MFKNILNLYWRVFGYPDLPPKFLFKGPYNIMGPYGKPARYKEMTWRWLVGNDVEIIAEKYNVTRTRVVNCIWKAFREL